MDGFPPQGDFFRCRQLSYRKCHPVSERRRIGWCCRPMRAISC